MARSTYVYVVQDGRGLVLATFTVKRELATWLKGNVPPFGPPVVIRFPDGGHGRHVMLNPATLKEVT